MFKKFDKLVSSREFWYWYFGFAIATLLHGITFNIGFAIVFGAIMCALSFFYFSLTGGKK